MVANQITTLSLYVDDVCVFLLVDELHGQNNQPCTQNNVINILYGKSPSDADRAQLLGYIAICYTPSKPYFVYYRLGLWGVVRQAKCN